MKIPSSVSAARLPPPAEAVLAATGELERRLPGRVSTSAQDRLCYSRDMWPLALLWIRKGLVPPPPDAVVWPGSEDEVREVVGWARARRVPLVPFGAGSGVCGGTWAVRGGVAVDLKRLERLGAVDEKNRWVDIEAGAVGEVLERKLNAQGYTLGHFPSSIYQSTLGGWLATRSAGQLSSRYGKIEDMVLSVRAVTGRGEVIETSQAPRTGPELAQLLIGSEGTLCLFTRARLRVHRFPEHRAFRGFHFRGVEAGLAGIRAIFRAGLRPAVVRLYDPFDTAFVGKDRAHEITAPSLRGALKADVLPVVLRKLAPVALGQSALLNKATEVFRSCLLVLMFEGEAQRTRREEELARELCVRSGGVDEGEGPARQWFKKRYAVSYKLSKVIDNGAFADTMEVACTWDKVLDVYERVRLAVGPFAFVLCHFSHAYLEGCSLYFSFVGSAPTHGSMQERYLQMWKAALTAAASAGATVTHHHGVGLLKADELVDELADGHQTLKALKATFDPDGIMNPGKLGL